MFLLLIYIYRERYIIESSEPKMSNFKTDMRW